MGETLLVIPVRMTSQRLPGKPLKDIGGQSLVERVYRQAIQSKLKTDVVIATDSPEIVEACNRINAPVVLTGSHHLTGSDRVAEAFSIFKQKGKNYQFVVNVQGDMPFINPKVIDQAIKTLSDSSKDVGMVTIVTPITEEEEFNEPSVVKAVLGVNEKALYFSRSPIPYPRNKPLNSNEPWGYKHIGLYVFRPDTLIRMSSFGPVFPEIREGLEQLRLLSNEIHIRASIIERSLLEPSIEVDTKEDLELACQIITR